jgi:uncharacterized protein
MGKKEKSEKWLNNGGKREKLLVEKKKRSAGKIIVIVILAAVLPVSWLIYRTVLQDEPQTLPASQVIESVSYEKQSVTMIPVEAIFEKGSVRVPVDLVKKNKLIYFEYQRKDGRIPLLAYITPSGKLVTAVSMCEPCNSTRFHIEGNQMVCNACSTRWDLETLKGISGGCLDYPPDALRHTVNGDKIDIQEMDLQNWKPRVLRG